MAHHWDVTACIDLQAAAGFAPKPSAAPSTPPLPDCVRPEERYASHVEWLWSELSVSMLGFSCSAVASAEVPTVVSKPFLSDARCDLCSRT